MAVVSPVHDVRMCPVYAPLPPPGGNIYAKLKFIACSYTE